MKRTAMELRAWAREQLESIGADPNEDGSVRVKANEALLRSVDAELSVPDLAPTLPASTTDPESHFISLPINEKRRQLAEGRALIARCEQRLAEDEQRLERGGHDGKDDDE